MSENNDLSLKDEMVIWLYKRSSDYPDTKIDKLIESFNCMTDKQTENFVISKLQPIISNIDMYIDLYLQEYEIENIKKEDYKKFKDYLIKLSKQY